jgi:hypothetical protein
MNGLRLRWIILVASVSLVAAAAPLKWIEVEGGSWRLDSSVLSEVQVALRSALPISMAANCENGMRIPISIRARVLFSVIAMYL